MKLAQSFTGPSDVLAHILKLEVGVQHCASG